MKKKTTLIKLLLTTLFLFALTTVKAQVSALTDLTSGTLAAYCPSETVKLTAASSGAASYVWKRYPGVGTTGTPVTLTATTANLTDTPTDPGYYTYVSTGLNSEGCESSVSDPATIYVLPGITAAIVSNNPTVTQYCQSAVPAGITLTATGGKAQTVTETFAYTYQWYKNGTAITGANTSTYTLNSTSDAVVGNNQAYTVSIGYVIKPSCTATTSNAINFNVIATPGKPTITITP